MGCTSLSLITRPDKPWNFQRHGKITDTKRLAFGGVNSQDLFDSEMAKILSGISMTLDNRDDIMIRGLGLTDHDKSWWLEG
jgi:hypothetical protein